MNNEIGRKLTSLTLMTIMLAGGMVIAAPSMVPEAAAANSTLFVSAENSIFNNTFSGPQVIEIVVSDPAIMLPLMVMMWSWLRLQMVVGMHIL